jgi:hypothetical protein
MDANIKMDIGPVMTELFLIHSKIEAIKDCLLDMNDEEIRQKYSESFREYFEKIVFEFNGRHPDIITEYPFET